MDRGENIIKQKDKITVKIGKTETTHSPDAISVSAPSITIRESDK